MWRTNLCARGSSMACRTGWRMLPVNGCYSLCTVYVDYFCLTACWRVVRSYHTITSPNLISIDHMSSEPSGCVAATTRVARRKRLATQKPALIGRSHGKLTCFTAAQFGRNEVSWDEVRWGEIYDLDAPIKTWIHDLTDRADICRVVLSRVSTRPDIIGRQRISTERENILLGL